jgi:hypothetical protein
MVLCAAAAAASAMLSPGAALAQPHNAAALAALPASVQARYDAAREQYEVGHFQLAFAAFTQLADEGHCDAARIAQQMVRYGRQLYADEFSVAPEKVARWRALPCPTALATR